MLDEESNSVIAKALMEMDAANPHMEEEKLFDGPPRPSYTDRPKERKMVFSEMQKATLSEQLLISKEGSILRLKEEWLARARQGILKIVKYSRRALASSSSTGCLTPMNRSILRSRSLLGV